MPVPSMRTRFAPSRRTIRVLLLVALLVGVASLANGLGAVGGGPTTPPPVDASGSTPTGSPTGTPPGEIALEPVINGSEVPTADVPPGAELTVVATQGFFVSDENAELVAFTRSGRLVYHNDTYQVYFDVDPVPGTRYTVEYVASKQLRGPDCSAFGSHRCTRNVVERVNLSTGAFERVWSDRTERIHGTRYHDADRLNETHLVVADIHEDGLFVVDARDGDVEWRWSAGAVYSRDQGGNEGDWTHINDVEVLADGRIMVSVRNMDEVVFLEPGEGVQESWTLGTDDGGVLYEQHNPDYLPADRGGPAVLVADSENNRLVEYHRTDDGWQRGWRWRDARLQWPRDADRLPNDDTLVVDSHGDRVLEVAPDGEVVWSVRIGMPYDAERLGTGDESAGGRAFAPDRRGGLGPGVSLVDRAVLLLKSVLPPVWVNSLLYVAPAGVLFGDLVVAAWLLLVALVWGGFEYRWSSLSLWTLARRVRSFVAARR